MFLLASTISLFYCFYPANAHRLNCESNYSMPTTALINLNLFHNGQSGIKSDHYLTTLKKTDASLADYSFQSTFGKVLTNPEGCDCLIRLVQLFDNESNSGRFDHKLIQDEEEDNRPFESYNALDEIIYCAQKHACGATIPLYKQFNFLELDSTYSTSNVTLPFSEVYPKKPLCYVWPIDYDTPTEEPVKTTKENLPSQEDTTKSSLIAGEKASEKEHNEEANNLTNFSSNLTEFD